MCSMEVFVISSAKPMGSTSSVIHKCHYTGLLQSLFGVNGTTINHVPQFHIGWRMMATYKSMESNILHIVMNSITIWRQKCQKEVITLSLMPMIRVAN